MAEGVGSPCHTVKGIEMTYILATYINFETSARQAVEFYQSVLGGKLTMSTFGEYGMAQREDENSLIMHAQLETDSGAVIMASDTPAYMEKPKHGGFSVALFGEDYDSVKDKFAALAEGGQILEPLVKAPWGDYFGMLQDQFGIAWMFNISGGGPDVAAEPEAGADS